MKSFSGAESVEINGLGIDPCAEQSRMGDFAVIDGATEAEAAGRGVKDESEPPAAPAAPLVGVFYKGENTIYQEWLAMRAKQTIAFLPTTGGYSLGWLHLAIARWWMR